MKPADFPKSIDRSRRSRRPLQAHDFRRSITILGKVRPLSSEDNGHDAACLETGPPGAHPLRLGLRSGRLAGPGSTARPPASADDLETRLRKLEELNEKLEKQNQKLAEQNDKLEKQNQQILKTAPAAVEAAPADAAPPTVQPDEVKKLVDGYLQEKDAAKAADAAKKAQGETEGNEAGSDLSLKTSWKDGFFAETANKDFQIHIGGKLQNDYGWFMPGTNLRNAFPTGTPAAPGPGPNAWNDGSDLRRARLPHRRHGLGLHRLRFRVRVRPDAAGHQFRRLGHDRQRHRPHGRLHRPKRPALRRQVPSRPLQGAV